MGGRYIPGIAPQTVAPDGGFTATNLAPGRWGFCVVPTSATMFNDTPTHVVELAPAQHEQNVTLVFDGGLEITGKVTDADGKPIGRAMVEVREMAVSLPKWGVEVHGDEMFRLRGLRPGKYTVRVSTELGAFEKEKSVDAGTKDLALSFPRMASVEGTVLRADNGARPWRSSMSENTGNSLPTYRHPE